jgi:iron complex outermembrane receptor protein
MKTTISGVLLTSAAVWLAAPAFAQTALRGDDADRETVRPGSLEEITVTGSRISRTSFEMPTPVQTLDAAQIEQSGLNNAGDLLTRVPSVGVGRGMNNAQQSPDAGSIFLDLRGLGVERTLTLVNGRRRVSGSSLSSAVDLSTIPAAMIERVEIITGGASAVYGADAVTGVVNIKLREQFDGLELSARTGTSQHGDANSYMVSIGAGGQFADQRGSIALGVTHTKDDPLMARDRDFARINRGHQPNPANTGPNDGIPDYISLYNWRITPTHPAGTFVIGGTRYTVDPTLRPTQNDRIIDSFLAEGGDGFDGGRWDQLRVGNETVSGLAALKYDISDHVRFFSDVHFAATKTHSPGQPTFNYGLPIQRDNPFIPAELGALMDANGLSTLSVDRTNYDHGPVTEDIARNTYTIVTGLDGAFGNGMKWEAFYQYGEYRGEKRQKNTRVTSRFLEAIDVILDPETGQLVCRSEAARDAGCQPLNILGQNQATSEAVEYFHHTRVSDVRNTQQVAGLSLTGDAFNLPAGPFSFAVGGEYRKEKLSARDDGLAVSGQLDPVFSTGFAPIDAEFDVTEAYVEVRAPILADKPMVDSLSLEAAARYSDYSTIGETAAWKVGGEWAPSRDLRFRVTRARSVRAPNLNELFSPGSFSLLSTIDPCDAARINDNPNRLANCRALGIPEGWIDPTGAFSNLALNGGNASLKEETSNSWTVGFVLTPAFAPGLSVSVDYWSIKIDDAINSIPDQQIADKCVDSESLDNPFCPLINRGDDFSIGIVDIRDINIGELSAEGVDFQVNYEFGDGLFGLPGRFLVNLSGTYLLKNEQLVDASDPTSLLVLDGEFTHPNWRANMGINYVGDAWLLSWNMRYIGPSEVDAQASPEKYADPHISSRLYHDLYTSYQFGRTLELNAGVNNVLDTEPPSNPAVYTGAGAIGTYSAGAFFDSIGRYFFVGLKSKF